jgi:hypothetical protein
MNSHDESPWERFQKHCQIPSLGPLSNAWIRSMSTAHVPIPCSYRVRNALLDCEYTIKEASLMLLHYSKIEVVDDSTPAVQISQVAFKALVTISICWSATRYRIRLIPNVKEQ